MSSGGRDADLVVGFELVTFRDPRTQSAERFTALRRALRCVPSNGTDVDHSVTELDKGTPSGRKQGPQPERCRCGVLPFNRDIQVRDVMEDEVHERFIFLFTDMLNKRLRRELFAQFVGGQPILGEPVIEFINNCKEEGFERQGHRNGVSRRTWAAIDGQLF